jgi:acyl-CoA thioester hydrolase
VVTETSVEFLAPARLDDQIIATAGLSELTRATFNIEQNIYLDNPERKLLLRSHVRAALLNADTMRPVRVPASIFEETKQ